MYTYNDVVNITWRKGVGGKYVNGGGVSVHNHVLYTLFCSQTHHVTLSNIK